MRSRAPVIVEVAFVAAAIVVLASCGAADPAPPAPAALLTEVHRELTASRHTHYQHHTDVDEAAGRYDYDCSGLLDYALGRVLPAALAALPVTTSSRPLAADIEHFLHALPAGTTTGGWTAVPTVAALQPGDVIAWLATEDSTTGDTGHVMIVTGRPEQNPHRPDEQLVHVADSTLNPHALDSRHPTAEQPSTGLGTGTIGLSVDSNDRPIAFYWRGGLTTTAVPTEIALGRPG